MEKAESCMKTVTGNVCLVLTGMSRHGRVKIKTIAHGDNTKHGTAKGRNQGEKPESGKS